jgi:hypothetical protein
MNQLLRELLFRKISTIISMKTIIAAVIALGLAASAQAEVIESKIDGPHSVPIVQGAPTEVTHIDLTCGTWLISGCVNIYQASQYGPVYCASSISVNVEVAIDGTSTTYDIQRSSPQAGTVCPLPLSSRLVRITTDRKVYLNGFSWQPWNQNPQAIAWGYISAYRVE